MLFALIDNLPRSMLYVMYILRSLFFSTLFFFLSYFHFSSSLPHALLPPCFLTCSCLQNGPTSFLHFCGDLSSDLLVFVSCKSRCYVSQSSVFKGCPTRFAHFLVQVHLFCKTYVAHFGAYLSSRLLVFVL